MINENKLQEVINSYKKIIVERWKDEKYKWEAVKCFQDNWDIDAIDFPNMLKDATAKTYNLLASNMFFPRRMIMKFSKVATEDVRNMFKVLFDEDRDLEERVKFFQSESERIRIKYRPNEDIWKNHYQNPNTISTYLWLRYPDKYYIYKSSEISKACNYLEMSFDKKNGRINETVSFNNQIREYLKKDQELISIVDSLTTTDLYPDLSRNTLTVDFVFYLGRVYLEEKSENPEWYPSLEEYNPEISVEAWIELLNNKEVFTESSLEIMKRIKDFGDSATCSQLAEKYGDSINFYNSGCSSLGKRIYEKTECKLLKSEGNGNYKYWPILFLGKSAGKEDKGVWIWKLRPELSDALNNVDLSNVNLYSADKKDNDTYTKTDFLSDVYMSEERYDSLISLLKNKKNVILQGAPGVGKTFAAKRLAYSMMGVKDESRIELIQFHQNYSYEDFMMGYKPSESGFEMRYGVFYQFCKKAANQPNQDFFFIIDEINRGNMSKIFGELLMLVEKAYRGVSTKLAYSDVKFSVPENVYIIGMMNTADRSLAMIDYALRRRFGFFEMLPGFNSDGFIKYQSEINNQKLDKLIIEVKNLNDAIKSDGALGKGFYIGHSYFCGHSSSEEDTWISEIVEYDLIPTLSEYWFDDEKTVEKWSDILRGAIK